MTIKVRIAAASNVQEDFTRLPNVDDLNVRYAKAQAAMVRSVLGRLSVPRSIPLCGMPA